MWKSLADLLFVPLNALAWLVEALMAVPVAGRLAKWAWNGVLSTLHWAAGLIEYLMMLAGVMPEKRLRLAVIVLRDEHGPLVPPEALQVPIDELVRLFREKANIRVQPVSAESQMAEGDAIERWVLVSPEVNDRRMLDVRCNQYALWEDLWLTGARYQFLATTRYRGSSLRRVSGYGAPLFTFVVREVKGYGGCSLGFLTDYVTIHRAHPQCLAHEVAHACNLMHRADDDNLMTPKTCGRNGLTRWQAAMLRASRHVTRY